MSHIFSVLELIRNENLDFLREIFVKSLNSILFTFSMGIFQNSRFFREMKT